MKKIKLTQGYFAIVDDEDYSSLNKRKWFVNSHKGRTIYVVTWDRITTPCKLLRMHRILLGLIDPKIYGEHKNGNGLDNRRCNLRIATNSQNQANRNKPLDNKSGYKGVCRNVHYVKGSKNSKGFSKAWQANIGVKGKVIFLGNYTTQEKAALVYNKAAKKYFGEFAQLNRIRELFKCLR